ncbi:Glycosyl transferase, group 2 family protein [Caenispirillum salinarum AK4]|uniref:Glycosyl transferase, group 2 family protein n=1 Tax=Caenispirillum salinarum AK4 TaxID=1238182 RepID=K9H2Z2_9PROT|nr:TIGR04283 family arsenosugar biosynthesis glycosyltransferase [Caenispirillum salinarum]EKV32605.1 Glycosyl transferase, group 2 family protein [Caenispirillum salinarum AK4]
MTPPADPPRLSVIIPTLNAAATLPATLVPLAEAGAAVEVIVADGGSTDGTPDLAPRPVSAPRGRGSQLAAGAAAARGAWLLFLHADTRLAPGWWAEVQAHMRHRPQMAAAFRFALEDPAPQARRIERLVAWRCRRMGLPYGDQGLLIPRGLYDAVGGFRPLPLMEDVDLVRRLGRKRIALLKTAAVTSAVRYRRDGWTARPARNLTCLALWWLGVPAARVAALYRGRGARS